MAELPVADGGVGRQVPAGGRSSTTICAPASRPPACTTSCWSRNRGQDFTDDAEAAKRGRQALLLQGVAVTRKEVMTGARMGRAVSVKKMKRAVQSIVDQVLTNETSVMGLTTIRDPDECTFTHSVNVCIFSVAIGKKLGLQKKQLYDLGLAALLHDIGKARVPLEVLNKKGARRGGVEDHQSTLARRAHPLRPQGGTARCRIARCWWRRGHHMKIDLTGYPRVIRPREQGTYSRLVAVADGFDAATTRRSYQTVPILRQGAQGDVGEPPSRLRSRDGEGAHQPPRHLPGRHLGGARHLRGGDRGGGQPRPDLPQPAAGAARPRSARRPPPCRPGPWWTSPSGMPRGSSSVPS